MLNFLVNSKVKYWLGFCFVNLIFLLMGFGIGYWGRGILMKETNVLDQRLDNALQTNEEVPALESVKVEKCDLYVDVAGAVVNPGVYCLGEGDLIANAISKAGDFDRSSYASKYIAQNLNLAQSLTSGQKLYIPFQEDVRCESLLPGSGQSSNEDGGCVSLNNAEKEEIMDLPDIGEVTAESIIDGRPYKAVEDLTEVKGIGDATFNKIKDLVCL